MKTSIAKIALLMAFSILVGCQQQAKKDVESEGINSKYEPKNYVQLKHPEWSKNATIYEVNIRQFSKAGDFKGFESHLPRLKGLGVDILWFMPIHPIGEKNRKGSKGSYYSVKDYLAINPEFGTMDEFKALVQKVHDLGMYVIIDWVANHSAWDNKLVKEHPEWYTRASSGSFQPTPWYDWDDIIDFDYEHPGIREYMTDALKFWVREADIDGYRCDVAGFMPIDFWENARAELDAIKPVFMLAEWESRDLHRKAFDATYSWSLWKEMKGVATGGHNIHALVEYLAHDVNTFPKDGIRMTFTENHDKNSWEGTQFSNFGDALPVAMVMASTVKGMPLIYSGQEAGLDRSLAFFEKDEIEWKEHEFTKMYKTLFALKHNNQALWNGAWGGDMVRVYSDKMEKVISFYREKNGNRVLPILNFSNEKLTVTLKTSDFKGDYTELFSGENFRLTGSDSFDLEPWDYLVLTK